MRIEELRREGKVIGYRARPIIDSKKQTVTARTKGEVQRQTMQLREQQRRRRLGLPDPEQRRPDITYGDLCERLLDGYTHKEQSKRTLGYNLLHSRATFENTLLRDITFEATRSWFAKLELAPTTRRHALTAMRQALNFGIETGYCSENPAKKIDKPEASENKHPFESWDEVLAVADAFTSPILRALVVFGCSTGLRPQEWRPLRWQDIDIANASLHINRTIQDGQIREGEAKTVSSLREVELSEDALEALAALPTPLRRDALVFPGPRGGFIDLAAFRRLESPGKTAGAWTQALLAAGLGYRPPSQMRHSFATLALADGADIHWISKQMGHRSVAITESKYRKWLKSDRRNISILNTARAERGGLKADAESETADAR